MSKSKIPTQTSYRSSTTGKFITPSRAAQHPATTEREQIKHPERK